MTATKSTTIQCNNYLNERTVSQISYVCMSLCLVSSMEAFPRTVQYFFIYILSRSTFFLCLQCKNISTIIIATDNGLPEINIYNGKVLIMNNIQHFVVYRCISSASTLHYRPEDSALNSTHDYYAWGMLTWWSKI